MNVNYESFQGLPDCDRPSHYSSDFITTFVEFLAVNLLALKINKVCSLNQETADCLVEQRVCYQEKTSKSNKGSVSGCKSIREINRSLSAKKLQHIQIPFNLILFETVF